MIVIDAARDMQVLDPYMTRTLRADVDEDRPTRQAITRTVRFSDAEQAFYEAIYAICLARAEAEGVPPGFVTQSAGAPNGQLRSRRGVRDSQKRHRS